MKGIIRKIAFNFFRFLVPELGLLKRLKKEFEGVIENTTIEQPIKIDERSKIYNSGIGKYTYISVGAFISNTKIGRFCSIGPGLLCGWGIHPTNGISTSPMFYSTAKQNGFSLSKSDQFLERKKISIGNDVFIGSNVTILDGVTIGDGAVIGAGCVVSKDIPPYAIAIGVPMQIIKYRFTDTQIKEFLRIKWWNWTDDKLPYISDNFFNIDKFLTEK
jgi:virginiamycin A acetyltransferase